MKIHYGRKWWVGKGAGTRGLRGHPVRYGAGMDPKLRQRMDRMYRNGAVAGGIILAACVGIILGGDHSPTLIAFTACIALSIGGQLWARSRN